MEDDDMTRAVAAAPVTVRPGAPGAYLPSVLY